jgi:hypothetical protein
MQRAAIIPALDEQIELVEEEVRRVVPEAELAFSLPAGPTGMWRTHM